MSPPVNLRLKLLVSFILAPIAMALAGCAADDPAPSEPAPTVDATDHHAHVDASESASKARTGQGSGTVRSVAADGRSVVVDHGPIEGIGMGAMTMSFLIDEGVAGETLVRDDEIAFVVESADGDFRITALCRPAVDGEDCLDAF